jgi:opacity protein-like surface antigen
LPPTDCEALMERHRRSVLIIVIGLLTCVPVLLAQTGEPLQETGEVSAYAGVGFSGLGTHPWVGGSTGISPSKYAVALIDVSFMPLNSETLRHNLADVTTSRLYDFNFTVHVQIPIHHRVTPYGLAGAALLYNTYLIPAVRPGGFAYIAGRSDVKFGFETGGGARYFVGKEWGLRGEYRYTVSTHNFSRILGGVFYQFDGTWPFMARSKRRGPTNAD